MPNPQGNRAPAWICMAHHPAGPPGSPPKWRQLRSRQPPQEERGPAWICVEHHSAGPPRNPRKWRQLRSRQGGEVEFVPVHGITPMYLPCAHESDESGAVGSPRGRARPHRGRKGGRRERAQALKTTHICLTCMYIKKMFSRFLSSPSVFSVPAMQRPQLARCDRVHCSARLAA